MTDNVIPGAWPVSERRSAHMFADEVRVSADKSPIGKKQVDRKCSVCGAVMVTVFGEAGSPSYRQWRLVGSDRQFDGPAPLCKSSEASDGR